MTRASGIAIVVLACLALGALTFDASALGAGQLASRPAEEWTKVLDAANRVASLRIDEIVARLPLKPGDIVADLGAGSGLFEVALAKKVSPGGTVYAVDIDEGFFPDIKKRAAEAGVTNVQTVLGTFTDPNLPVKNVDVAFFHDVLHHVEDRERDRNPTLPENVALRYEIELLRVSDQWDNSYGAALDKDRDHL